MRKLEYKKIKLRDFRHKFTQLKDSIASGQAYEVLERGEPIGYFIPSQFDIKVIDTKLQNSRRDLIKQNLLQFLSATEACDVIFTNDIKDFNKLKKLLGVDINIISKYNHGK